MKQERMVEVSVDFVAEALYSRRDDVKDKRASAIHYKVVDDFIEIVSESGGHIHTPSYVIDNWLVNGEHGTYEDIWKYDIDDEGEYEGTDEQKEKCRERCEDNGYYYDDDLEEYCD